MTDAHDTDLAAQTPYSGRDVAEAKEDGNFLDRIGTGIRPRFVSNLLLWIIAIVFVVFLTWAYFAEVDRTVRGQGRIVPSARMQVVSNLEGGIVEEILVGVGEQVEQGDPLIQLDETQTGSELGSNRAQFNALAVKIARLEAEVGGREPRFPAAADQSTREQIEIERSLHIARMADLSSLTLALRARTTQAQRAVSEAQANYAARVSARNAAQTELTLIRPLVERGIEPRLSLVQAESSALVASSEASAAAASISRAQASVAEAQASLNQAQQDWRSQAATELAAAQAEQAARRRALPALADRVDRTVIRAPLSGRVNRVMVATVGGTVRPGDPIAEIVPDDETLIVEVMIRPADIGRVRMDQRARVDISAYDSAVYGWLEGRVVTISPDTTTEERTGDTFYTVRVATEGALLDRDGSEIPLGPGMTTTVSLLGDRRSVLQYILTPITRLNRAAFSE